MRVILPAVMAVNHKLRRCRIRQIAFTTAVVEGRAVQYTVDRSVGHALMDVNGVTLLYLFPTRPKTTLLPADAPVLAASYSSLDGDEIDLSHGTWLSHPTNRAEALRPAQLAAAARESWKHAFRFVEEDVERGVTGLRRPQLGALHALHAHWSTSRETATVVMPTGTGKTETMLAALVSTKCERVLVVVPTDALRSQIAGKFESLGILKLPGSTVLAGRAVRPVVGTLTSKPKTVGEVDEIFELCNVVVSTSQLVGQCSTEVQIRIAAQCTHLFIDEAHHAEAPTWRTFRKLFGEKLVLQFTATPFREDGQKVDGKLIYVYPLKKAQDEGYFRPIRFHAVREFNAASGDRKIAQAALEELDADTTGKHIVMARVADTTRASAILKLYRTLGRHEAVAIHSGLPPKEAEAAKKKLLDRSARVVVCVDMLGEGFDLPELKIAAFHDIRKSLAVTLQLAGRFTRVRADLGDPVFIANTALIDVRDELRKLYAQDPDWNVLLPELSTAAIDDEILSQEFFRGFGVFLDEVPLKDLRPAASMVVYKTNCANWTPKRFRQGLRGLASGDKVFHSVNEVENTLVVLTATEQSVRWSEVESVRETVWEMFVAVWDRQRALLYLHGSGLSGEYKELAKALCGPEVQLVVAPNIFRCFHGIKRLVLNNVGLNEHLGRQVRFTGRMGSDVEARIGQAARRGAKRAVLAGTGFEHGKKTSVGAAKRGRVWSNLRLRVDTFAAWAQAIGEKVVDEAISPDVVLAGTLKPEPVGLVPASTAIAAEWPKEVLERPEAGCRFFGPGIVEAPSTNVDIEVLPRVLTDPLLVRVYSQGWESVLRLSLVHVEESFDFEFVHERGAAIEIALGSRIEPLAEFFTSCPPVVWFADGSSLEGCEYTRLPTDDMPPYDPQRLQVVDWTGVDIRAESQGEERRPGTVQHRIIELLRRNPVYSVIFDDDGAGEAADVVAITIPPGEAGESIEVELYHLKYAGGAPGARVDDLYVVCGQAQRSTTWLASHDRRIDLFTHLLKRNDQRIERGRPTRFERGTEEVLLQIREMSRRVEVKLKVYIVQPGLSKAAASASQLRLLAVTERFLSDTYEVPFSVLCSA